MRTVREEVAQDFLGLCRSLDDETRYMMLEPGERQWTVKLGYELEGTKKHSLLVNGSYVDEFYMARLLR